MHHLPCTVHFDDDARLVVRGNFYPVRRGSTDEQGVTGNGAVAVTLDVEVREVEASHGFLAFRLRAEDRLFLGVGGHHKFVEGQAIDAMRRDPPLVEREIGRGGLVVGSHIIFVDALQVTA